MLSKKKGDRRWLTTRTVDGTPITLEMPPVRPFSLICCERIALAMSWAELETLTGKGKTPKVCMHVVHNDQEARI